MKVKIVLGAVVCFCFGMALSVEAQRSMKRTGPKNTGNSVEPNTKAAPHPREDVFLVKGIAADAKGPLRNKP